MEQVQHRAENDARTHGYYLNPDPTFLRSLLEGLKRNEERYGYPSCPCRLASGTFELDRDIVCPCDYRDPDVVEYGYCYCSLYVRKDVYDGTVPRTPIPERRPEEKQERAYGLVEASSIPVSPEKETTPIASFAEEPVELKLWYCKQCGYVVFREDPPYVCPICQAERNMFAEMKLRTDVRG